MAQQEVDSKVGDLTAANSEAGVSGQNKQVPTPVKVAPLRDLHSENNIAAQKGSINPAILKESIISGFAKVLGVKRPTYSPMSPHHQSSNNNGANARLVYVRRKLEAEIGKNSNNESTADNANSSPPSQDGLKEDALQPKSLIGEPQMQTLPALPSSPTCVVSIPSEKLSLPLSLRNSNTDSSFVEHKTEAVSSSVSLPVEVKVKEHNWEDRYVQLQTYLKRLDQTSLEDHLQLLRSLSAGELSRRAVELEKRAIQLSLEQGKELQRVKSLNVLGKSIKNTNGPSVQQPTLQS